MEFYLPYEGYPDNTNSEDSEENEVRWGPYPKVLYDDVDFANQGIAEQQFYTKLQQQKVLIEEYKWKKIDIIDDSDMNSSIK